MNIKKTFELEYSTGYPANAVAEIIKLDSNGKHYLRITDENGSAPLFVKTKELKKFAENILKALNNCPVS
jgi:hypothetical protein